jgi:hypothetical protein
VVGVKGKTGNPGVKNPKKKASTSFSALGTERKGRQMGFRPPESLEKGIDEALQATGLKTAEFLELAARAYLEKSTEQMQQDLEQLLKKRQYIHDPSRPLPKNVRRDAIAYLEKSSAEAGQQLEQGHLSEDNSRTEEPPTTESDE